MSLPATMSKAKISVQKHESKEEILFDFDKSFKLDEILLQILAKFSLPSDKNVYSLKLVESKEHNTYYITEDNYGSIKDGDKLLVVHSVKQKVKEIFDHIEGPFKEQSFKYLLELSIEPTFVKELVLTNNHSKIVEMFNEMPLKGIELEACLVNITHLFKVGYFTDTQHDLVSKTITIVNTTLLSNNGENARTEYENSAHYAIILIRNILVNRNEVFVPWKEKIIKEISLGVLFQYIWDAKTNAVVKKGALSLINTIIKICKGEKQVQLIKEINLKRNREYIFTHFIQRQNLDADTEHQLYLYQCFLLSLFTDALRSAINVNNSNLISEGEFELKAKEDIRKMSMYLDFDESVPLSKFASVEDLVEEKDTRLSLASVLSDTTSTSSSFQSHFTVPNYVHDFDNPTISYLTVEALRFYRDMHRNNFIQSQIEETVYKPGLLITSEWIVKMLAKLLHIGIEADKRCTVYQPIVFCCSSKTPFFMELFSRTMWLLSKTRREMKASTWPDFHKVMRVLEQQVELILKKKPMDFKTLTEEIGNVSFETVMEHWHNQRQKELENLLKNHPCIRALKEDFVKQNEQLVREQRLNFVHSESELIQVTGEKKNNKIKVFVKVYNNNKSIVIRKDVSNATPEKFSIENITHLVQGRNCMQSTECKDPNQAFDIIINHTNRLQFKAETTRIASYWVDALSILIHKSEEQMKSRYYKEELEELAIMDVKLKILDLQMVPIPKKAPKIPPLPEKPLVPPKPDKSKYLSMH